MLPLLLPWCASWCCSTCHGLALLLCLYWCSPRSSLCLCACHCCCCSSCVIAHEHPVMLMACQVAPATAAAAKLSCVSIFFAPGLIIVSNPCILQEPVPLLCFSLSYNTWKCSNVLGCWLDSSIPRWCATVYIYKWLIYLPMMQLLLNYGYFIYLVHELVLGLALACTCMLWHILMIIWASVAWWLPTDLWLVSHWCFSLCLGDTLACAGACFCFLKHLLMIAVILWIICMYLGHCLLMYFIYLCSLAWLNR
jgi:hypothetical protein